MCSKSMFFRSIIFVLLMAVALSCAGCSTVDTEDATTGDPINETLDTTDHDHQHQWDLVETVEPWFERRGFSRYVCGICGQEFDTDFVDALVAESIHCVFIQGDMVVRPDTDIQTLRNGLHVFAACTNGMEVELDSYALSGALEAQTSIIKVEFMEFSATFNVSVEME